MITKYIHHPVTNRLALIAGIAVFVIVIFWVSFASMWDLWQTSDHRHGILVFPISAFLIWQLRHQLIGIPVHFDPRGLLLVAPLAVLWLVARFAGVQVVEHVAVLAMIPAAAFALMGLEIVRKTLFPLLFILAALPVGDTLIPYLMIITADISTGLLKISGIPVLREGQYLSLPGGNFVVADVCSGLRYMITGVMVSLLFGYLTYSGLVKRALLVAVTAVTLVIANGIRAYIVMAVASATNLQYFGGRDHIYFGWLLFGIVMMLILWIGGRYTDEPQVSETAHDLGTAVPRTSHTVLPMIAALGLIMLAITVKQFQADFGETIAMLAVAVSLLAFIYVMARQRDVAATEVSAGSGAYMKSGLGSLFAGIVTVAILIMTPRFVAGLEDKAVRDIDEADAYPYIACEPSGPWSNHWRPDFREPDVEYALAFDCEGHTVNVYVAVYASALQGRELISASHRPVPPGWDRFSSTAKYAVKNAEGDTRDVVEIVVSRSTNEAIVWYWYDIDGRIATSPMHTKVLQVMALVQGRPAGGRVTVIETPVDGNAVIARERLGRAAGLLMSRTAAESRRDSS